MRAFSIFAVIAFGVLAGSMPAKTNIGPTVGVDAAKASKRVSEWELRFVKLGEAPSWNNVPIPKFNKPHKKRHARVIPRPAKVVVSAPAPQPARGFTIADMFGNFDPGSWAVGQLAGQFPVPNNPAGMLGGNVVNTAAQAIYSAAVIAIKENREMGNGEACFLFDALFNPTPIPIFRKPCEEFYAKHDLCKEKWMRNYPGLRGQEIGSQLDLIPLEAREAWYDEDYCDAKPQHQYDALRATAGKKSRTHLARK